MKFRRAKAIQSVSAKPLTPIAAILHASSRLPSKQLLLRPRNIFIFPSRRGFLCLGTIGVIWLLGTNYQNNLVLGLAYLLAAIGFLAIFETYKNLHHLTLQVQQVHHNFLGSPAGISIRVTGAPGRIHHNVKLGFSRYQLMTLDRIDGAAEAHLWWTTYARGKSAPPRVRIWSRYPLRLLHAWSWYTCDSEVLTYPKPLHQAQINEFGAGQPKLDSHDEFTGLRDHQLGDSPKHISWKHFARDNRLRTKLYSAPPDDDLWLELDTSVDTETALSQLCYWVILYSNEQRRFGLNLSGQLLEPATGEAHRDQALTLLALFDTHTASSSQRSAAARAATTNA